MRLIMGALCLAGICILRLTGNLVVILRHGVVDYGACKVLNHSAKPTAAVIWKTEYG